MYKDLEIILKELHPIKISTFYDDISNSIMFAAEGWTPENRPGFYVTAFDLDDLIRRFIDQRIQPPLKRSE